MVWSSDGKYIASLSIEREPAPTVQVWSATTGRTVWNWEGYGNEIVWSPDGKYLACAFYDYTVQIWDAATGSTYQTSDRIPLYLGTVAWSSDSKRIASISIDTSGKSTVRIWDVATKQTLLIYDQPNSYVGGHIGNQGVTWSPDGRYIASSIGDHTVQVWDTATGRTLLTYDHQGRNGSPYTYGVAWSPDGKYITTLFEDGRIRVWKAP